MRLSKLFLSVLFLLLVCKLANSQESKYKPSSIRTFIGAGFYEGQKEDGAGLVYGIGYQKTNKKNNRLRINPQLMIGGFQKLFITDIPTQHFRITNLSLNAHYDLLRLAPFALVVSGGIFGNYTRGYLGNNGYGQTNPRRGSMFYSFYYGGTGSIGIRVNTEKVSYEVRPLSIYLGNKGLGFGFISFGMDIKLKK